MRIYAIIGRTLFQLIRPLLRLYFNYESSRRVRIIVKTDNNEIVLIKGWFSSQLWELPGGGIHRGELDVIAAIRELYEETGLQVEKDDMKFLGEYNNTETLMPFVVVLYVVTIDGYNFKRSKFRQLEIIDQQLFFLKKLPTDVNPLVPKLLRRLSEVE